jgi:hypothetical protein
MSGANETAINKYNSRVDRETKTKPLEPAARIQSGHFVNSERPILAAPKCRLEAGAPDCALAPQLTSARAKIIIPSIDLE